MTIEIWLVYAGTVLILMSTPGPSHLLMLSNSLSSGFQRSIFTAAGDLTANFIQMIVASIGLAGAIASSREFFVAVKWAGVVYLAYLGLRLIFSRAGDELRVHERKRSRRTLFWQGFVTSAANPKAVVFFAALFPQFIDPERALLGQFLFLSATYLVIDAAFLCTYGKSADWLSTRLSAVARRYLDKVSGSFLLGAAILRGFKDLEPR